MSSYRNGKMIITLRDSTGSNTYSYDSDLGRIGENCHVTAYVAEYRTADGARPVVIKVPKETTQADNDRMQRQAEATSDTGLLPQVVEVLSVTQSDGTEKKELVVEYVRGITMRQFVNNDLKPKFEAVQTGVQSLHNRYVIAPDRVACALAKGVAAALGEMHGNGVCHNELTADGVIITAEGSVRLSSTGQAMKASSPGERQELVADDICRLGVVAYELCAGSCDTEVADMDNVGSASMADFITRALDGDFASLDAAIAFLDGITSFEPRAKKTTLLGSIFGRKQRQRTFNITTRLI